MQIPDQKVAFVWDEGQASALFSNFKPRNIVFKRTVIIGYYGESGTLILASMFAALNQQQLNVLF